MSAEPFLSSDPTPLTESTASTRPADIAGCLANPPAPITAYKLKSANGQEILSRGSRGNSQYAVSVTENSVKLERTDADETDELVVSLEAIIAVAFSERSQLTIIVSD